MKEIFLVLGEERDLIVRSDGAIRPLKTGLILPFLKHAKLKLVKTDDNEFQVQFRNKGERFFFDNNVTGWGEPAWKQLTEEEKMASREISQRFRDDMPPELKARQEAVSETQAARVRELVNQPGYQFQTIRNDSSDGSASGPR